MAKGCFELSGNDPFIVMEDSDVKLAVNKAFAGRLANSGQACVGGRRFLIHE